MAEGGVPGYSSIIYITSESMTKLYSSRVCGTKGRVSKRTEPANEALSRALQADEVKQIAKTLSHRPELENSELSIVMAGDSICMSTLYNPGLNIKNILLRSNVIAVKDKCQDIIKIFPNATVKLCWMDGKSILQTAHQSSPMTTST